MPIISISIMGGLGNQMFQLAVAYAYSRRYNYRLEIQKENNNGNRPYYWHSILKKWNNYLVDSIPNTLSIYNEQQDTTYIPIPQLENGIYLKGYYQTSKYFYNDTIKLEIKELMKPSLELLEEVKYKYSYLFKNRDRIIVIHARRTDYLTFAPIHGPLSTDYYINAIDKMLNKISNPIFLMTSDDNSYWNELKSVYPKINNYEQYILENESDIYTMALLQQFSYYIMANSTFIWWCVWLSDNTKYVIAPSKWFGPSGPKEYNDIYENNWERI
jgi:hypothetical protein